MAGVPRLFHAMSDSDSWCTPADLAADLGWFAVDPCSNARSHIQAGVTYQLERNEDGLAADWGTNSVFVNPPYSAPLAWARKLSTHPGPWVALVKLDTTTKWWRTLMETPGALWSPFRGRLKFGAPGKHLTANFASALVWKDWTPSAAMRTRLWAPIVGQP